MRLERAASKNWAEAQSATAPGGASGDGRSGCCDLAAAQALPRRGAADRRAAVLRLALQGAWAAWEALPGAERSAHCAGRARAAIKLAAM